MSEPPPLPPPMSTEQLEALVAGATADEMRRALRIVLGAEQAYWERDLRTDEIWYSPPFFSILGLPPTQDRELINARIHPEDRARFAVAYAQALSHGGTFSYDVRYLDMHGTYRWARAFGRVWLDAHDQRPLRLIGTMIDVHAERQARLDADAHALRYRRALDAASEAHFERTAAADDFFVSDNFPQLLGHPDGAPVPDGQAVAGLVHPEDKPRLDAEIARALAAPCTWDATYRLRLADGGWRWFRGRGRSEFDSQGRMRVSGMLGDVHQQELDRQELDRHRHHLSEMVDERTAKLNAALAEAQRQREQAEQANKAKSEFLAHMSHELRTPLNGVLGFTELALKVAEQPAQRRYLDVALSSGRALLQLINDVLELSRLEEGDLDLVQQPFDLAQLLAEAMREQTPSARAKSLAIRYDWTGDVTRVLGDPVAVRQVVNCLLANAIKFAERGHVALRAEIVRSDDGHTRAVVRIDDSGPGVDPARSESIFEPFVQGDASLTRQHGGGGLGLTIARRVARALGGDVVLERSGSEGSTFAFAWPVRVAPDAVPLPAVASGLAWLIFSQPASGWWVQRRFGRLGWRVELPVDLPAAVELARRVPAEEQPAVVVMSEKMLLASTDFAQLRAAWPRAHIVLLVPPNWDQPALERGALAQGVQVAVPPLTPQVIHGMLTATAPRAAGGVASGSTSGARVLVVEDNAVNLMITEEFVRQLGHEPTGATDGARAIVACQQQPPQLVLMDLQMPVMDGFEATRRLRALQADGRLPRFPIIALSAHAGDADRRQGAVAGMDDYLTKPILVDALRSALTRWLADASG